jgi:hypothetical protein
MSGDETKVIRRSNKRRGKKWKVGRESEKRKSGNQAIK